MDNFPLYQEDHISQIPAIQLLMKLGYKYISPVQALVLRDNRTSNVLLTPILKEQLAKINGIIVKKNLQSAERILSPKNTSNKY